MFSGRYINPSQMRREIHNPVIRQVDYDREEINDQIFSDHFLLALDDYWNEN
jgi:hypothetical protein